MPFSSPALNPRFLGPDRNLNDATGADGVSISPAAVIKGQGYWRCIGVHHLTPEENAGGHSVFLEALDENGKRIPAWIGWTWAGRQSHEPARPIRIDKPINEAGADIALFAHQKVNVWVLGMDRANAEISDTVTNLHTGHPDEGHGNTWGHHSYYVVFQRTVKKAGETPPPAPDPEPTPGHEYTIGTRVTYLVNTDGKALAEVANLETARRIVAALKVLDASEADRSIESYRDALKKWAEGEI